MVGATTATWIDDLWHDPRYAWDDPEIDARRIAHAFRQLRRVLERWPTLVDFAKHLPAPPDVPALKHQPCSPEQAAANVKRALEMIDSLSWGAP